MQIDRIVIQVPRELKTKLRIYCALKGKNLTDGVKQIIEDAIKDVKIDQAGQ